MGLVTLRYVLQKARQGNYAVGGFNFFTLYSRYHLLWLRDY